jgi:hypothetical protein
MTPRPTTHRLRAPKRTAIRNRRPFPLPTGSPSLAVMPRSGEMNASSSASSVVRGPSKLRDG